MLHYSKFYLDEWESTLAQAGFTADGVKNLILMTKAVIDGKIKSDSPNPTSFYGFPTYLERTV